MIQLDTFTKPIQKRIQYWLSDDFDSQTQTDINHLLETDQEQELINRFYKSLEFGTAGMRGEMGAGSNRINKYTLGMATQGVANYIQSIEPEDKMYGVVIGYDSRHCSKEYAEYCACILAANGIKVKLFQDMCPTPVVSFAIIQNNALAGIMITASHNPRNYNGYKVYWEDGGQILPPHDKGVSDEVNSISSVKEIQSIDFDKALADGMIEYVDAGIYDVFIETLDAALYYPELTENEKKTVKIGYTPLFGVGYCCFTQTLDFYGFTNWAVFPDQAKPDGNFPNLEYPNPEEPSVLKPALEWAQTEGCDLLLGTDPDADRLACALWKDNQWHLLTGNQLGVLLTYYVLEILTQQEILPTDGIVISTIVSTRMTRAICDAYQVEYTDVLTGFKYFSELLTQFRSKRGTPEFRTFLFGFEESIGYLPGSYCQDKDAIGTGLLLAEMVHWLKKSNKDLLDCLHDLYLHFGYYSEETINIQLTGYSGTQKIKRIMDMLRNHPPTFIDNHEVIKIRDVLLSRILHKKNNKTQFITMAKSNVLTFYTTDDVELTVRPSGTEPKLKFYIHQHTKPPAQREHDPMAYIQQAASEHQQKAARIKSQISNWIDS